MIPIASSVNVYLFSITIMVQVPGVELPSGWEWIDDWHLDMTSANTTDGWVYAPDVGNLKWPKSYDPSRFANHARQRRWIRNRKQSRHISGDSNLEICIGSLKPGDIFPLPLSALSQSGLYMLRLRPSNLNNPIEYSWSSMVDKSNESGDFSKSNLPSGICVSTLTESDELLYCTEISGTSSSGFHKLWFCISVQATEIAKDIRSNPIQDWNLVIKSPLAITNFLPLTAEFSVMEAKKSGNFVASSRGILCPGKAVNIYNADIRNPLLFSLFPQRGWLPVHVRFLLPLVLFLLPFILIFLIVSFFLCILVEFLKKFPVFFKQEAVLISHPHEVPSKTMSLRSSISGRSLSTCIFSWCNKDLFFPGKQKTSKAPLFCRK